ncbi:MAG: hypothetical protein CO103_02230 [Chloroflexi bacterium CG_4_9_14_3_um_filter_45_9]|nr:MAG: hypothetical protein CO103_02230 [Chloroflexi bacterium CG_4_9_14_3_um_filter_45_9]
MEQYVFIEIAFKKSDSVYVFLSCFLYVFLKLLEMTYYGTVCLYRNCFQKIGQRVCLFEHEFVCLFEANNQNENLVSSLYHKELHKLTSVGAEKTYSTAYSRGTYVFLILKAIQKRHIS